MSSLKAQRDTLKSKLDAVQKKIGALESANRRMTAMKLRDQKEISELHHSQAYRVGMFVTWPVRKAWNLVRRNG